MNTLARQREALISQLAELHETGWEFSEQLAWERRMGGKGPSRSEKRSLLELEAEISSVERKLQRIETYLACQPGCSCRGVMR